MENFNNHEGNEIYSGIIHHVNFLIDIHKLILTIINRITFSIIYDKLNYRIRQFVEFKESAEKNVKNLNNLKNLQNLKKKI